MPLPRVSGLPGTSGRGETIFAPQATALVARATASRGETVEIAFPALNHPDQLDFFGFSRYQSLITRNFAYLLNFHDPASLMRLLKFQLEMRLPLLAKAWRGRQKATLTDINKLNLLQQRQMPGIRIHCALRVFTIPARSENMSFIGF